MSITISLSQEASQMVQSRIESGEFADAQSVIEAVLIDAAKAQDIVDAWVINDVLPNLEVRSIHRPQRHSGHLF